METYEIIGNIGKIDEVQASDRNEALRKHLKDVGYNNENEVPDHVELPKVKKGNIVY